MTMTTKKKTKAKAWLIPENTYRVPIWLVVGDQKSGIEWIKKYYADKDEDLSFLSPTCQGHFLWKAKKKDVVVWIKDKNDLPCLAHELLHYAIAVLELRGVPVDEKTSEALTYLHQCVFIHSLIILGHKKLAGSCVK